MIIETQFGEVEEKANPNGNIWDICWVGFKAEKENEAYANHKYWVFEKIYFH